MLCQPRPPRANRFACSSYVMPGRLAKLYLAPGDSIVSAIERPGRMRSSATRLVAIPVERLLDRLRRRRREHRGAAQLPRPLRRHPRSQVAGAGRAMLHLAGRGQAKPLLRTFVCLLLGHGRNLQNRIGSKSRTAENPILYRRSQIEKRGTARRNKPLNFPNFRHPAAKKPLHLAAELARRVRNTPSSCPSSPRHADQHSPPTALGPRHPPELSSRPRTTIRPPPR